MKIRLARKLWYVTADFCFSSHLKSIFNLFSVSTSDFISLLSLGRKENKGKFGWLPFRIEQLEGNYKDHQFQHALTGMGHHARKPAPSQLRCVSRCPAWPPPGSSVPFPFCHQFPAAEPGTNAPSPAQGAAGSTEVLSASSSPGWATRVYSASPRGMCLPVLLQPMFPSLGAFKYLNILFLLWSPELHTELKVRL